ncbi:MAG TPA: ABC transporter permease [Actinomycetota bacterium]|jgi:spermidine/putrescine transport system permease protein
MGTIAAEVPEQITATTAPPPRHHRPWWRGKILPVYSALVLLYLVTPILVMILYSFNQSHARLPQVSFKWQGFTLQWYKQWNGIPGLTPAFRLTLILASLSAIVAAAVGTLLALALVRYRFRGKVATEQVMFLNIAAPEIVIGASLLGLFVTLNLPRGFDTLFLAHVTFCIAYVAITVRARLAGFDRSLEEAAQDLGANAWVTFQKVTLPLIWPGVLAGALMAFALSIDDFVISNFVAGNVETFPLWIYGAVRVGIPPQVFVLGTVIFAAGVLIATLNLVLQRKKK